MANIENNKEKENQNSSFLNSQNLKTKVYDFIEKELKDSTNRILAKEDIQTNENSEKKEQQGWNRGVYGDGSMYGVGLEKGKATVTINRNKGSKASTGFFEKIITLDSKRMVSEIHVDLNVDLKKLNITYKTTEDSFFRGYNDEKGPFMINDKSVLSVGKFEEFKKELKNKLDDFSEKEINYILKTKIGVGDRIENSINSIVEANMNKISLKDIINSDFNETLDKIMESSKNKKDLNNPEVKKANSPGNLLFDDLEEMESKKGKEYREYFEGRMKECGASSLEELKQSEIKSIDMDWNSKQENTISEISATAGAGSVGTFQYDAPFGVQKRNFKDTEYSKKNKKRTLKRENKNGWTTIELDSDGYAPKGMNKNYAMGLHGVDINSEEEDKLSKGSPKGRAAINESFDLAKRKFVTESEYTEKGINKRYIITHKLDSEQEKNKWRNLSNFEKYSTIKLAESCGCGLEDDSIKLVSREQGEEENNSEFMRRNDNVDHGDELNGKKVIVVPKPNSLTNASFKVFEDDYLNEHKAFILDLQTGNLVNNPNYKKY